MTRTLMGAMFGAGPQTASCDGHMYVKCVGVGVWRALLWRCLGQRRM